MRIKRKEQTKNRIQLKLAITSLSLLGDEALAVAASVSEDFAGVEAEGDQAEAAGLADDE